jgi:hypothetical protein
MKFFLSVISFALLQNMGLAEVMGKEHEMLRGGENTRGLQTQTECVADENCRWIKGACYCKGSTYKTEQDRTDGIVRECPPVDKTGTRYDGKQVGAKVLLSRSRSCQPSRSLTRSNCFFSCLYTSLP